MNSINQQLGHRGKFPMGGGAGDLIQGTDGMWAVCFRNHLNQEETDIRLIFSQYGEVGPIRSSGVWTFVRFRTEAEARASMEDPCIQSSLGDIVKAARCTKTDLSKSQSGEQEGAKEQESGSSNSMPGNVGGQRGDGQGNFNNRGGQSTSEQPQTVQDARTGGPAQRYQNLPNATPMNQQYGQINRQYPASPTVENTSSALNLENAVNSAPKQNKSSSAPTGNDSKSTIDSNSTPAAGPNSNSVGISSSEPSGSNRLPYALNQGRPYQGNNFQPRQTRGRPQYPARGGGRQPPNHQSYRFPQGGQQPNIYPGQYGSPNQEAQNSGPNNQTFTEGGVPIRGPPRQYGGPNQGNNGHRYANRGPEGVQANQYHQNNQPRGPPPGAHDARQQGGNPYTGDNRKPGFNQNRAPNAKQYSYPRYGQSEGNFTSRNPAGSHARRAYRGNEGPNSPTQVDTDYPLEPVATKRVPPVNAVELQKMVANQVALKQAQGPPRQSDSLPRAFEETLTKLKMLSVQEDAPITRTIRTAPMVYAADEGEEQGADIDESQPELDYDEELEPGTYQDIVIANYPKDFSEDDLWHLFGDTDVQHLSSHCTESMEYCNLQVTSNQKIKELMAMDSCEVSGKKLIVRYAEDLIGMGLHKIQLEQIGLMLKQNALRGKKKMELRGQAAYQP